MNILSIFVKENNLWYELDCLMSGHEVVTGIFIVLHLVCILIRI